MVKLGQWGGMSEGVKALSPGSGGCQEALWIFSEPRRRENRAKDRQTHYFPCAAYHRTVSSKAAAREWLGAKPRVSRIAVISAAE